VIAVAATASVYEGETPDGHRFCWRVCPSADLITSNKTEG
jgi:hypothetical protein